MSTKTERDERINNLIEELAIEVNVLGDHGPVIDALADALNRQHRTLQQSIAGVLINGLRQWGHNTRTDLRNEASTSYCASLPETNFPLI